MSDLKTVFKARYGTSEEMNANGCHNNSGSYYNLVEICVNEKQVSNEAYIFTKSSYEDDEWVEEVVDDVGLMIFLDEIFKSDEVVVSLDTFNWSRPYINFSRGEVKDNG